jgi:protein O-mannose beta-1,4-N-acetylglucosaminyltransferase
MASSYLDNEGPYPYTAAYQPIGRGEQWNHRGGTVRNNRPDSKYRLSRPRWRKTLRRAAKYGLWAACLLGALWWLLGQLETRRQDLHTRLLQQSAQLAELSERLRQRMPPDVVGPESPMPQDVPAVNLGVLPVNDANSNEPEQEIAPDLLKQDPSTSSNGDGDVIEDSREDFSRLVIFNELPASSMACFGRNVTQRFCKFRTLCYDGKRDVFFVVRKPGTMVLNGRESNDTRLLDTTSIDGHNKFFFNIIERDAAEPELQNVRVHWVPRLTFVFSRFHRLNIMHSMHDDFLGMYVLHRLFAPTDYNDPTMPFSRENNLFFLDNYGVEKYDHLWALLSTREPQRRAFWRPSSDPLCFSDAVVGNSKALSWYHYGFLAPQGPLSRAVDGLVVRDAADFVMRRLQLPGWDRNATSRALHTLHHVFLQRLASRTTERKRWTQLSDDTAVIALLSRTKDRLIVNKEELREELQAAYGLPVVEVRMEDMDLKEQAAILRKAVVAIGMHGSALILGMFLPPGALLVELFPYRIPAENYTPYKTMAGLPGMQLAYKAWVNEHADHSIAHPERSPETGGLKHLPAEEQQRILELGTVPRHLCCKDPVWLFRIYQDTIVHIPELLRVIDEGLTESFNVVNLPQRAIYHVAPASIDHVECETTMAEREEEDDDDEMSYHLHVSWSLPWNGAESPAYGLWVHQIYQELMANGTTSLTLRHCVPGTDYELWVRPVYNDSLTGELQLGSYSDKFTCKCMPGAKAVRDIKS